MSGRPGVDVLVGHQATTLSVPCIQRGVPMAPAMSSGPDLQGAQHRQTWVPHFVAWNVNLTVPVLPVGDAGMAAFRPRAGTPCVVRRGAEDEDWVDVLLDPQAMRSSFVSGGLK